MPTLALTSLRARLVLLVLLAVLPAVGLMLYANAEERGRAVAQVQQTALDVARAAADDQDQLIGGSAQLLTALAQLPSMQEGAAACTARMESLLPHYPQYVNLGFVGLDGVITCSAVPLTGVVNVSDRTWFQRTVETRSFAIGDYQIGRVTGKPAINVGYPVVDSDRQLRGVLYTSLSLDWLDQLAAEADLPAGATMTLMDQGGVVLMHYPQQAGVVGEPAAEADLITETLGDNQEATTEATDAAGVPQLYSMVRMQVGQDASSVFLTVRIPAAVAFIGPNRVLTRNMLGLGGASLLALAAAWFGADLLLLRRLRAMVQATQQVSAGNLDVQLPAMGRDELGLLAGAFNQMTMHLRQSRSAEVAAHEAETALRRNEQVSRELLERTVATYLSFVQEVARGNLARRLDQLPRGTLGELGQGLNTMVENLHRMTGQVQEASQAVAAAAAEILAVTTQQAASAAEQSAAITQTTTTIEEIKAIGLQTAHQAAQVVRDSENALLAAREGTQSVEETVTGMGQIRTRVESIAQTILALAEQTQAIGAVTATVSELADQSNLLALNAAIEAARAGEQGKSFAVVAQHVRELAERSKGATVQVREILSEIQKATNAAVLVTEEGTKGVEAGARLASRAGQVIHRIAVEVEGGAQANTQMAAAAQQQTAGMEQIGQAMGSIQQATTQTLASTRQAERAARDLSSLAQSLQQAIAVYHL